MYILFNSIEEFNEWHSGIKSILNIPSEDGATLEYTVAISSVINLDPRVVASFTHGDFETDGLNLISIENIFDSGILTRIEVEHNG